jgi:pimeloyl-ACP methyl ester carboxylesterase
VTLRYAESGRGPLVLLLHGFPDYSYGWRHQLPALAAAGYRAVAPDLRGYTRSSKPRGVRAYDVARLGEDVAALVQALGGGRAAAIVGHDWGGVIAWHLAARRPELLDRLVVLNAPHPMAFARELRTPGQLLRSGYAFFFQLPVVPEVVLRGGGSYAPLLRAFERMVLRPGAFTGADRERHREAVAQPGALTAMLHYYRATGRRQARQLAGLLVRRALGRGRGAVGVPAPEPAVRTPTLLLWGERDPALSPRLTERLEPWVPTLTVRRFPDAGHWVQLDEWEAVNEAMVGWMKE